MNETTFPVLKISQHGLRGTVQLSSNLVNREQRNGMTIDSTTVGIGSNFRSPGECYIKINVKDVPAKVDELAELNGGKVEFSTYSANGERKSVIRRNY